MSLKSVLGKILGIAEPLAGPIATAIAGPAGGGVVAAIESGIHIIEGNPATPATGAVVPGTTASLANHVQLAEAIVDDLIKGVGVATGNTTESAVLKQKVDNFVTALLELKAELPVALSGFKI